MGRALLLRRAGAVAAALLCFGVLAGGCSDEFTGTGDGSGLPDAGDGSGSDASGGVGGGCLTSDACQAGLICTAGQCLEGCSAEVPCTGPLPICDETRGVCIACRQNADCAGGERCVGAVCQALCAGNADCPAGTACNTVTGACVPAQCRENRDCRGGEICRANRCEPVDEPDGCTAGERRCRGNAIEVCTADGARFRVETPCGDDRCEETPEGTVCVPTGCEPDSIGCLDADTAFLCEADGVTRTPLPCPSGRGCNDGVCRNRICEPLSVTCEEDALVACDASGLSRQAVSCQDLPDCREAAQGCACVGGACVPRSCIPGRRECVGPGVRTCLPDGSGFGSVVNCPSDATCTRGECIPDVCTPGETTCAATLRLVCNAQGNGWIEVDCANDGQICQVDERGVARCSTPVCTPSTSRCTGDGRQVLTCSSDGLTESRRDCPSNRTCQGGICVEQVCTPNTVSCRSSEVYRCNATGTDADFVQRCSAGEVCQAGACVVDNRECLSFNDCPRRPARCDGPVLVTDSGNGACSGGTCNWSGVESRTDCSTSGRICNAAQAACTTPPSARNCRNDDECIALAQSQGVQNTNGIVCDPNIGCMLVGHCNPAPGAVPPSGRPFSGRTDPFNAPCPSGTVCDYHDPIIGPGYRWACINCELGGPCRQGEICREPFLTAGIEPNWCGQPSGGGGLPFPFPFP
jgi:hypothetical protein